MSVIAEFLLWVLVEGLGLRWSRRANKFFSPAVRLAIYGCFGIVMVVVFFMLNGIGG